MRARTRNSFLGRSKHVLAVGFAVVLLGSGCATAPSRPAQLEVHPPQDAFVTHRAILTARGREFALNGYLAQSQTRGLRLIVTELLGQVLADVLVEPNGQVSVVRSSPMIRPEWIRQYVAPDAAAIFGGAPDETASIKWISPDHVYLKRRRYTLDVRILETRPGAQASELFDRTNNP